MPTRHLLFAMPGRPGEPAWTTRWFGGLAPIPARWLVASLNAVRNSGKRRARTEFSQLSRREQADIGYPTWADLAGKTERKNQPE